MDCQQTKATAVSGWGEEKKSIGLEETAENTMNKR